MKIYKTKKITSLKFKYNLTSIVSRFCLDLHKSFTLVLNYNWHHNNSLSYTTQFLLNRFLRGEKSWKPIHNDVWWNQSWYFWDVRERKRYKLLYFASHTLLPLNAIHNKVNLLHFKSFKSSKGIKLITSNDWWKRRKI